MNSKVNELSSTEHQVEASLKYEEISKEIDEVFQKERKTIEIQGFRKGKAPIAMIKKLYGEAIEYKASEDIANKKFWEIVETEKLKPINPPQMVDLNFVPGKELSFKVKYEVMPVLELKDYKDLEVKKPVFKVREEDIEKEIDHMLKSQATFEETELVSDKNHRIVVDMQRLDKDGKALDGQKSENLLIDLTDDRVNLNIIENALQKKKDDTFKFSFKNEIPPKEGEEIVDEEFFYEAVIKKVEKIVTPEATEEIVQKLSNNQAKTIDELKDNLKENFEKYYQDQSKRIFENELLNKVVDNNNIEAPKGYTEVILERMVKMEKENAKQQNAPAFDDKSAVEYLRPRAVWNAKWQILVENLCRVENIKIEDSDLEKMATEEAEKTGISKDKLIKYYKDSGRADSLVEEKVLDFLKENNKIIEIDSEEFQKEKESKK